MVIRCVFGFALFIMIGVQSTRASTISGTVYDGHHNGLANVAVELMNSYHALIRHGMTDGIGRYSFEGLSDGDYYVRVLPFRYDYEEETRNVTIQTISQSSTREGYTIEIVDFVLTPQKGTMAAAQAEVVVAQEIPPEAKKAYDSSLKVLKKGKIDEAIPALQEALKIFPDYFLANSALGSIYFDRKDYEHAVPLLMKASQVYDRSPMTLYLLGVSLSKLNYNKAAIIALKAAIVIAPSSVAIYTALGTAQRMERDYAEAEASLLKAKKLMKTANSEVYKELAALYGDLKQYDKGAMNLEEMLKAGTFSDEDVAKIKEQIKIWKGMASQPSAKPNG